MENTLSARGLLSGLRWMGWVYNSTATTSGLNYFCIGKNATFMIVSGW